jgi:hypothetical protein
LLALEDQHLVELTGRSTHTPHRSDQHKRTDRTRDLFEPQCALDEYTGTGKIEVRRQRGVDDEIDIARRDAGALDRFLGRRRGERGAGLTLGDPP